MEPAERTQVDGLQEQYSDLTGIACTPEEDRTRQEFKQEADINDLLRRFGIGVPQKQTVFAEVDFQLDLQSAYQAVADVKEGWDRLPPHIKQKYPTWEAISDALTTGKLVNTGGELTEPAPVAELPA